MLDDMLELPGQETRKRRHRNLDLAEVTSRSMPSLSWLALAVQRLPVLESADADPLVNQLRLKKPRTFDRGLSRTHL